MYFIAVVLPEELNRKVLPLKQYMLDDYHCKVGLKSPAHITIAPPFWMDHALEQDLLSDVDHLSRQFSAFPLHTNNFSAFKPRTIFIAVKHSGELNTLKKQADEFFGAKPQYKIKIENRPFHPHITIATRDLLKKAFSEAWPHFEKQAFEEEWTAQGLSVLRHNTRNWDVIHTGMFGQQ